MYENTFVYTLQILLVFNMGPVTLKRKTSNLCYSLCNIRSKWGFTLLGMYIKYFFSYGYPLIVGPVIVLLPLYMRILCPYGKYSASNSTNISFTAKTNFDTLLSFTVTLHTTTPRTTDILKAYKPMNVNCTSNLYTYIYWWHPIVL